MTDENSLPIPTDPAAQQRAGHFAALLALLEDKRARLEAAGQAADLVARREVDPDASGFMQFVEDTLDASDVVIEAIREYESARVALRDALLARDDE